MNAVRNSLAASNLQVLKGFGIKNLAKFRKLAALSRKKQEHILFVTKQVVSVMLFKTAVEQLFPDAVLLFLIPYENVPVDIWLGEAVKRILAV
jgi:hypothetical protein